MKRVIFIGLMLSVLFAGKAQTAFTLTDGVPSIVYALPKTELTFVVEVEKRIEKPGVFMSSAQRYLGATKIITEEKTTYRIKSVHVTSAAVPDPARRFVVAPVAGSALNRVQVDEQGILLGINVSPEQKEIEKLIETKQEPAITVMTAAGLLPLTREYMLAGTSVKLAEGAASQIYDIRASRLNLLTGDNERVPSFESLKFMLANLDQKESELTELFVGSVSTVTEKRVITFVPERDKLRDVLFRISAKRGLVAKDDLGGEPFYISLLPERIPVNPGETDPKKRIEVLSLYSVMPAQTLVKLSDGIETYYEKIHYLPQLGELVSVPEAILKSPQVKVQIHRETGRLMRLDY